MSGRKGGALLGLVLQFLVLRLELEPHLHANFTLFRGQRFCVGDLIELGLLEHLILSPGVRSIFVLLAFFESGHLFLSQALLLRHK